MQYKRQTSKEEKGPSCFGCDKFGHLKSECPDLIKLKGKVSSSDKSRGKRAYIAWEDDETSSTRSDSENDEVAQLCFMGQKKKPLEVSDSDSNFNHSYNELQNAIVEMHGDAMKAFKTIGTPKESYSQIGSRYYKNKERF